jgi:hypothetical protein
MELVLNLAWLLLALPACWLWRGAKGAERKFSSLQCLLALGCVLVILFPVISATDDLMAMRTEMEESPVSKRSIHQASQDKASGWSARLQIQPALTGTPTLFAPAVEQGALPSSSSVFLPSAPVLLPAGRAPPVSRLT